MESFTKGEWIAVGRVCDDFRIKVADKKGFAGKYIGTCRAESDAHLIAAAPKMYEMLKLIIDPDVNVDSVICGIADLLEKARGE